MLRVLLRRLVMRSEKRLMQGARVQPYTQSRGRGETVTHPTQTARDHGHYGSQTRAKRSGRAW